MGLIGGVKSWMQGSRRQNLSDSRAASPRGREAEESSSAEGSGSEEGDEGRGRKVRKVEANAGA